MDGRVNLYPSNEVFSWMEKAVAAVMCMSFDLLLNS